MNGVKNPPLTAVEESRHLGAKVFDKEHNKITIKMALENTQTMLIPF